jgi:hypothetical protein
VWYFYGGGRITFIGKEKEGREEGREEGMEGGRKGGRKGEEMRGMKVKRRKERRKGGAAFLVAFFSHLQVVFFPLRKRRNLQPDIEDRGEMTERKHPSGEEGIQKRDTTIGKR